jgi:hypothetical protein
MDWRAAQLGGTISSSKSTQTFPPLNRPLSLARRKKSTFLIWCRRALIALLAIYNIAYVVKMSPPHVKDAFLFDFSNFYGGARAWIGGHDPYAMRQVYRAWQQSAPGPHLGLHDLEKTHLWAAIYPPSSLVMLAPLTILPALPAHLVWLAICITLFCVMCAMIISMARIRGWESRLLVILLLMTWGPGLDSIDAGQLAFPAGVALIGTIWAMRRKRFTLAGLLLGYAAALKIQLGLPFILFYLLIHKWRVGGLAASVLLVTSLIGIIQLELRGIPWQREWMQNAAQTLLPGQDNDPRPGGPFRNDMINLQTLLYGATGNNAEVEMLVAAITIPALVVLLVLMHYTPRPSTDLLLISLIAMLSFLPIYRRLYDAGVLALLGVWAVRHLHTPLRRFAIVTMILLAELMIPVDFIPILARRLHFSTSLIDSRFWQMFVVPHHAWGMLFLSGWTLFMVAAIRLRAVTLHSHRRVIPT